MASLLNAVHLINNESVVILEFRYQLSKVTLPVG